MIKNTTLSKLHHATCKILSSSIFTQNCQNFLLPKFLLAFTYLLLYKSWKNIIIGIAFVDLLCLKLCLLYFFIDCLSSFRLVNELCQFALNSSIQYTSMSSTWDIAGTSSRASQLQTQISKEDLLKTLGNQLNMDFSQYERWTRKTKVTRPPPPPKDGNFMKWVKSGVFWYCIMNV